MHTTTARAERYKAIAREACRLFEAAGRPRGFGWAHWLEAERVVMERELGATVVNGSGTPAAASGLRPHESAFDAAKKAQAA